MAARSSRQDVDFIRTTPKQSRSEATVAAIFEASARILQRHGVAAYNTNAVAALAGVSVGTLYQYFANKDAILIAMARRELGEALAGVVSGLRSKREEPDIEPTRAAVRAVLKAFGGRQRFRKVLIETLIARGMSEELSRPVELIAQAIAERLREGADKGVSDISPIRLFVLTRAVVGVIRAAVMEQSEFLDTEGLEDELVALVQTYFRSFALRSPPLGVNPAPPSPAAP
jgi:AcrR family transcriptional regulator